MDGPISRGRQGRIPNRRLRKTAGTRRRPDQHHESRHQQNHEDGEHFPVHAAEKKHTHGNGRDHCKCSEVRFLQQQSAGTLTVSTSPNFASKWLVHRLGRFAELHPGIDLRVGAALHHVDFAREDLDVAIRHSDGNLPGLAVTRLCKEELFPVCSPEFLAGAAPLQQPADLARHTLLHLDSRQDWLKWFDAAGVTEVDLSRGPVLNQASMVIDAAVDGQGVALARTALAARDLLAGRLVRPFDLALPVSYAYWIVCPRANADLPKIATFREWLLGEAAEETRRLEAMKPA